MKRKGAVGATERFEEAIRNAGEERYVLRLYITGHTRQSSRAVANLKALCEKYLPGRYDLEVVDIYQQPDRSQEMDIVAAPTLVRELPTPLRRFIGDLSDTQRILVGLDIRQKPR